MKVGVYIDASNITLNGGYAMRYDILKEFCLKAGENPIRLNTYLAYDDKRAQEDFEYRRNQDAYSSVLRSFGFKVVRKNVRRYETEDGTFNVKGNADLDLAVDILLQSRHLDKIYILTGDGDFGRVVSAVQDYGTRVEVIAFKNVSSQLVRTADMFTSGFVIPNLVEIKGQDGERNQPAEDWGKTSTYIRGECYNISEGYGFLRYYDLDFQSHQIFFHFSELPDGRPPKMNGIYEFRIDEGDKGLLAKDMTYIT